MPSATGLARDIHQSRCERSMRAFATCLDHDQYREPARKRRRISGADSNLTRIESRMMPAQFTLRSFSSFETHRRALRLIPLTRWRRADVAFVKKTFPAFFKAVSRFDESSGDRLVVRKIGT
jgi:hypothetical protein